MSRSHARASWTAVALLLSATGTASAQRTALPTLGPVPALTVSVCSGAAVRRDPVVGTALAALDLPLSDARPILVQLEDSLEVLLPDHPDDVALHFHLAVVLGARTDLEEGRDKLDVVEELIPVLHHVLALDPSHPGAQYLLGRLNAAAMRLSWLARFVATRVLGASELSSASWEEAQRLLESAAEGNPCAADPTYELARLYVDRGEPELAIEQLERLARQGAADPHGRAVVERGMDLLASLRGR